MKYRISNDFKERLLKGEITNNFDVNLYAVNSHFKNVYDTDDMAFEQFRRLNEFNIFSHNNFRIASEYNKNCLSACMFDYFTMPVSYSAYYNNDVADKPLFVNAENWEIFRSIYLPIEGEANIERIHTYLDANSRDFADRNGGFYYIQEKSQMKWLANRVNNEYDFNNKLIIVLGDDLGGIGKPTADGSLVESYSELDFCICPVADHPFNGLFDLNGHTIQMFNIQCREYSNGIIGYLGNNGVVCNGRIGNLRFYNHKKISLDTIKNENTDIFVGGLVGTNYGIVENIETFGDIEFIGFMPEVYLVQNKEEYSEGVDTIKENSDKNVWWPDRYCLNSPWNVIPYVGYFCEGADSYFNSRTLEDGLAYEGHWEQGYHEMKRVVHNFYDTSHHIIHPVGESDILDHKSYKVAWGMLTNCKIPISQYLDGESDNEDDLTNKLAAQFTSNFGEYGTGGYNHLRSLLVSHCAECSFLGGEIAGDNSVSVKNVNNWRVNYHKRMNKLGRNAYFCSPIVGTNFGNIITVTANARLVESSDTFVGFIGMIVGKHNKGVISGVVSRLSIVDNNSHKDTQRIYTNSQQFDGEQRNRAFGYYYNRNMNTNNKHKETNTFNIPSYSLCYLDANPGPSGPDWSYAYTSGWNWFHQMGSHNYDYCNWFVKEGENVEAISSGSNWVVCDPNSIGSAFKNDEVVNSVTSAALKLHLSHNAAVTYEDERIICDNYDFALSLKYTHDIQTNNENEIHYKPAVRFFSTETIKPEQMPNDITDPNRIYTVRQVYGNSWQTLSRNDNENPLYCDDMGVPNVKFNSFIQVPADWEDDDSFDFDVTEFKLEYLTNNWQQKRIDQNKDSLYYESDADYTHSAFKSYQADMSSAYSAVYETFSDTSGQFYVVDDSVKMTCSGRAEKIAEAMMLQGIALGAQCPYHVAHEADTNYMAKLDEKDEDGAYEHGHIFYRIWGDPGINGGHDKRFGFLGFNTNDYCKHDMLEGGSELQENTSFKESVRSSMATIYVDNTTLPSTFVEKIKEVFKNQILTNQDDPIINEAKVQIEMINVPIWNTSMNSRRSVAIGNSDYYHNYIYFNYNRTDDADGKKLNEYNVSWTYIHFSVLLPDAIFDCATNELKYDYNHCKIYKGILELPSVCFDIPICITHVSEKIIDDEIPDVTVTTRANVFKNYKEYMEKIAAGEPCDVEPGEVSIPEYSIGLEEPEWHSKIDAQKVDVFIEMAPYSLDAVAAENSITYDMPSIYNVGGIAGMYAPSFVGPDFTQGITDWGSSKYHAIQNCIITVEPTAKNFVERSSYAHIKGQAANKVITENLSNSVYTFNNNSDYGVTNKFAGIAPILEINAGDMGVLPGATLSWTMVQGNNFTYNPHPEYMKQYGRYSEHIRNVEVIIKPHMIKESRYLTTTPINNQFFSNYFNWCNHTMEFDASMGAFQMTTDSYSNGDRHFVYGVTWDQPNALAPMLGRYWIEFKHNKAISSNSLSKEEKKYGYNYQLGFAEWAGGSEVNMGDLLTGEKGWQWTDGWGQYVINTPYLFGHFCQPIAATQKITSMCWADKSKRQAFMRHYDIAPTLMTFTNVRSYQASINANGTIHWNKDVSIRDIYMNPMMNSFMDSCDLYQPMYSENSNFCNMKLSRPVMTTLAYNNNFDSTNYIPDQTYTEYEDFNEHLDVCNHFADKGEVKDNVFTYDYEFGNASHHEIGKPALTANIHYNKQKFLFKQKEGDVYMPITRKGKYNDGSVLHLGLIPTASVLPSLISESENGVYTGSVAVSGQDLAGFIITDQAEDPNIIGMLDFERSVNLNSGAFVYQYNKVIQEDDDQKYGLLVEVK